MKRLKTAGLVIMLGMLGGGCVTTDDPAARMQERADILVLQEKLTRAEGRMESLEMEYHRLLNEMERLRAQSGEADPRQRAMQSRLDAMEQRLTALDAARERDRQAIVDQLSGRITEVIRAGAPAKTGARPAGATGAGYEHEVQAGETLSAIAAAYKVSVKVITDANDLKDPDHLRKGQKLFIPK